jgi:Uma2 family endonuclease
MTAPDFWSDQSRALTVEDMENQPDDEFRYELDDGVLIVSPAPAPLHQRATFRLGQVLDAAGATSRLPRWRGTRRSRPRCRSL